jgi:hypothetical protein
MNVTNRQHFDLDSCLRRYPRLARNVAWLGILSRTETGACLRDYRDGRDMPGRESLVRYGGSEAVCQCGGPLDLIRRAIAHRASIRTVATRRWS